MSTGTDLPDLRLVIGADIEHESVAHPCVNPEHHDTHPSMLVYRDHLHCFACGYHRAGEAALLALTNCDDVSAALERTQNLSRAGVAERTAKLSWRTLREQPLRPVVATLYHQHLLGPMCHRLDWLHERGLTRATIDQAGLGYNLNRFVLPVWDRDGRTLLTLRYRLDPATASAEALRKSKYLGISGRNAPVLYGAWWLARKWAARLVLCEGEFDALRLHQEGVAAIALTNGAGQLGKAMGLLREMFPRRRLSQLVVASDMDEAGEQAAKDVAAAVAALMPAVSVERVRWDRAAYGKDVTDFLQAGGDARLFGETQMADSDAA